MNIITVGIELTRNVLSLYGLDAQDKAMQCEEGRLARQAAGMKWFNGARH